MLTYLLDIPQIFGLFSVIRVIIFAVTIWGPYKVWKMGIKMTKGLWLLIGAFAFFALDNFMTALIGILNASVGQYRDLYIGPYMELRIYISIGVGFGLYLIFFKWWPWRLSHIKAQEKLERVLQDMKYLTSASSHQIRGPLGTIQGYISLLEVEALEGDLGVEDMQEYFSFIDYEVKRLRALVDKFSEYVKLESLTANKTDVDITHVIMDIRDSLGLDDFALSIPHDSLVVLADEQHMHALFQNLVENGLKFNESATPTVMVSYERHEGWAKINVADNGIGVEPEYLERIFNVFERLNKDDRFTGSGVGLAMVKKIVEAHDGSIKAYPQEGGGSVFSVCLPVLGVSNG